MAAITNPQLAEMLAKEEIKAQKNIDIDEEYVRKLYSMFYHLSGINLLYYYRIKSFKNNKFVETVYKDMRKLITENIDDEDEKLLRYALKNRGYLKEFCDDITCNITRATPPPHHDSIVK